jgi:hypothetical protein
MSSLLDQLIASWQARRTMLESQLEMLESGEMSGVTNVSHVLIEQDIQRLSSLINELDALLERYEKVDPQRQGKRAPSPMERGLG